MKKQTKKLSSIFFKGFGLIIAGFLLVMGNVFFVFTHLADFNEDAVLLEFICVFLVFATLASVGSVLLAKGLINK